MEESSPAGEWMPRSVLVTGASGFIGRQLVARLAALSDPLESLVALDIHPVPEVARLEGVHYAVGDVRDDGLNALLAEHGVETVVHLAAIVTPPPGISRAELHSIDVGGTKNVVEACLAQGVRRIVVTSSGAAYGYHADNPIPLCEDDPLRGNPEFAYSDHKRLVEAYLERQRIEHPQLEQVIFRPGTILGPGARNPITNLFDQRFVLGIAGAQTPFVFISGEDVAASLVKAVRGGPPGIYNLAGDGAVSMAEIARAIGKPFIVLPAWLLRSALAVLQPLGLTQYGPEQVDFLRYRPVLSNERLKSEFGFTPSRTSREVFDDFWRSRAREARAVPFLRDCHVVVTGASGGLGRALCDSLLAAGAHVSALDIDAAALDAMQDADRTGRLLCRRVDITDAAACERSFDELRLRAGPVDVLVNNAGITHFSKVVDLSPETAAQVMAVNFMGAVHCTQAALPDLLERKGQVVVLSSVAGFAPLYARSAYSASKHALHGFFETLRGEVQSQGVNVLLVCPSFIATQREGAEAKSPYVGAARPGSARATVGELLSPEDAARQIVQAMRARRSSLLLGRVAKQSWWLRRIWPSLYDRSMIRRARREVEGPA